MSWPLIVIAATAAYLFLRAYVVEPYDLEVVEHLYLLDISIEPETDEDVEA